MRSPARMGPITSKFEIHACCGLCTHSWAILQGQPTLYHDYCFLLLGLPISAIAGNNVALPCYKAKCFFGNNKFDISIHVSFEHLATVLVLVNTGAVRNCP